MTKRVCISPVLPAHFILIENKRFLKEHFFDIFPTKKTPTKSKQFYFFFFFERRGSFISSAADRRTSCLLFPFLFFLPPQCVCMIWNSPRPVCAAWVIRHMWTITNFIWGESLLSECPRQAGQVRGGTRQRRDSNHHHTCSTFYDRLFIFFWYCDINLSDATKAKLNEFSKQTCIYLQFDFFVLFILVLVILCSCRSNLETYISSTAADRCSA